MAGLGVAHFALVAVLARAASGAEVVRVDVARGANASCPWHVTVGSAVGTAINLCAEQLSLSFQGRVLVEGPPGGDGDYQGNVSKKYPHPSNSRAEAPDGNYSPRETLPPPALPTRVPRGYFQLGDSFYKVHAEHLTWRKARAACEAEGAHLVVLNSNAEAATLSAQLNLDDELPASLHAGFYVDFRTQQGRSLSSLGYERWAPGQPAAAVCGRIDNDAWLLLGPCAQRLKFVCELGTAAPPALTTETFPPELQTSTRGGKIPSGYVPAPGRNDSYYNKISLDQIRYYGYASWIKASKLCHDDNAELGLVESEDEAEALKDLLQTFGDNTHETQLKAYVQANLFHLGVGASEVVTVLGIPLSSAGYSRWVMKPVLEPRICADSKMLFYSCPSLVNYALCELKLA